MGIKFLAIQYLVCSTHMSLGIMECSPLVILRSGAGEEEAGGVPPPKVEVTGGVLCSTRVELTRMVDKAGERGTA